MREMEIHDYARQLLEAHGPKAIAEAAQNAIDLEQKGELELAKNLAAYRRRHEADARAAPKLKLPSREAGLTAATTPNVDRHSPSQAVQVAAERHTRSRRRLSTLGAKPWLRNVRQPKIS